MYTGLLHTHNLLRWLILITFLIVLIYSFRGWFGKKDWTKRDNLMGILLTLFADLQLVIGLILYFFVSPFTKAAFADFGAAMKNSDLRFYAVEHILIMIIALVLIHIGRAKTKRELLSVRKYKAASIWYGIAFVLVVAAIPWDRALM